MELPKRERLAVPAERRAEDGEHWDTVGQRQHRAQVLGDAQLAACGQCLVQGGGTPSKTDAARTWPRATVSSAPRLCIGSPGGRDSDAASLQRRWTVANPLMGCPFPGSRQGASVRGSGWGGAEVTRKTRARNSEERGRMQVRG